VAEASSAVAVHEGVEEWLELMEQALQGLHHALNNRIGSLSAVVELFQLGDLPADAASFESMASDLTRLGECSRMVRLLPRDAVSGEEPLILDDVLADVFAVHRFLHDLRDVQVTIVPMPYVEPVRVTRWALVRALTLLLYDAKRLARTERANVRAVSESDEQWVRLDFQVGAPGLVDAIPARPESRYAESLATLIGGSVNRGPGIVGLRLPTLKARRASDRR
jgi:hypothetical protein